MRYILPEYSGTVMETETRPQESTPAREIEQRLQHAIKLDLYYNKQLALKTKHLNNQLVNLGE